MSKAENSRYHRAWVAFHHATDINFPFEGIRIAGGFWTYGLTVEYSRDAKNHTFKNYTIGAQLARFDLRENVTLEQPQRIVIEATSSVAAKSINTTYCDNYGFIDWNDRQDLVSERDLLNIIRQ